MADVPMAVIAIFKYEVKPGRLPDFLKKLAEAADPKFTSPVMPKSVACVPHDRARPRHRRNLMLEYEDMAAYGARTAFEQANAEWQNCSSRSATARRSSSRWSC